MLSGGDLEHRESEVTAWVKISQIIPEFSILRLTFIESHPQTTELGRS